jgi:hypothetical protein
MPYMPLASKTFAGSAFTGMPSQASACVRALPFQALPK